MFRYIVPIVLIVGALAIRAHNHAQRYQKLVFPGLASISFLKGDAYLQGEYTWYIVLAMGVVLLLIAAWTSYVDYRRREIKRRGHKPKGGGVR